jgi:hypothetical protein
MDLDMEYPATHEELDEILSNHEVCRITVEHSDFNIDLRGDIKYGHNYDLSGEEKFISFISGSEPNNISVVADDASISRIMGIRGYDYKIVLNSGVEIYIFTK